MTLSFENAEVYLDAANRYLSLPNINGMDVGYKTVKGHQTHQLAIVFYVDEKKHEHLLSDNDTLIPRELELTLCDTSGNATTARVTTDVVPRQPPKLWVLNERVRPTVGGYEISVLANWIGYNSPTGTLAVNIVWGGSLRLLSNNHVISDNGNLYADVYQPEYIISTYNQVAAVTGYEPIRSYANQNQADPVRNVYDFAWADIEAELASKDILGIGEPAGIRAPVLNETVRWIGKQTGVQQAGTIASISHQMTVGFGQARYSFWKNTIQITGGAGQPGDSGSAIVADSDDNLVGLLMAGSAGNPSIYACRIPPYGNG